MKLSATDTVLVEGYVALLEGLSFENRKAIIARLEALSIPKGTAGETKTRFQCAFGAFESVETAEELIQTIRERRVSTRKTKLF